MTDNDLLSRRMASLSDQCCAVAASHESNEHAGQPCLGNRVAMAAHLCRQLGLVSPRHLKAVAMAVREAVVGRGNGGEQ